MDNKEVGDGVDLSKSSGSRVTEILASLVVRGLLRKNPTIIGDERTVDSAGLVGLTAGVYAESSKEAASRRVHGWVRRTTHNGRCVFRRK